MKHGALGTIAMAAASVALVVSTIGAPAASASAPLSGQGCSAKRLSEIVAVYLGAPVAKPTPVPMPRGVSTYLSRVLRSRLASCEAALGAGQTGACKPSRGERNDVRQLWAHLRFCETLVTSPPSAASEMIPWELPGATGFKPVIFVMGFGADVPMVSKLVSTLTVFLNAGRDEAGYHFVGNAILIPEPTLTLASYAAQCESSPNVEGAIVVNIGASGSGSSDEFISRRSWTAIEATTSYAQCSHTTARGSPAFTWLSNIERQESQHSTFTPLMPLATLLALTSMYEDFAPVRSTNVTSRRTGIPAPKPVPSTGYVSEVDTSNTTSYNASQLGGIAGSFLGSSINYTNSSAPLTPTAVDLQTWNTLQALAMKLIGDMNCWQAAPQAIGTPAAADIVGGARRLPAYNPPAGLGQYHPLGRPSAPFCREPGLAEPNNHASIRMLLPGTPQPATRPTPRP